MINIGSNRNRHLSKHFVNFSRLAFFKEGVHLPGAVWSSLSACLCLFCWKCFWVFLFLFSSLCFGLDLKLQCSVGFPFWVPPATVLFLPPPHPSGQVQLSATCLIHFPLKPFQSFLPVFASVLCSVCVFSESCGESLYRHFVCENVWVWCNAICDRFCSKSPIILLHVHTFCPTWPVLWKHLYL